jgi:glutamine---fructose-6-phosphate transaminase (isomerizing)
MCGIMGVVGRPGAVGVALEGLRRLEYRGYDSCGYVYEHARTLRVVKTVGGVANLQNEADGTETVALGHTRWATHGGVTQANAHPHLDCTGRISVVHNGIIENYRELKERLVADGHSFRSETDTEVLPHLLEENGGDLLESLRSVLKKIRGSFSIAAVRAGEDALVFAKNSTPLIIGETATARFLASDPNALAGITDRVVYIEDGQHGRITPMGLELFNARGETLGPNWVTISWSAEESDKAGFPHYMLKEIYETPAVVNRVLSGRVFFGPPYLTLGLDPSLTNPKRVKLLGAGTSYHACLIGAAYLRQLAGIPAQAELAPEYKDSGATEEPGTLFLAVSQSGETLDTLEALKSIEGRGHPVIAVTNNPNSSIGRRADAVIPLNAGPEIGVAATKTFIAQVITLLLFAIKVARSNGRIGHSETAGLAHALKELPRVFSRILSESGPIVEAGQFLAKYGHSFVLGKGLLLHAAQEGALKLKEIAYQHSEGYSAGELKHGPFALLTAETPAVFLVSRQGLVSKVMNNVMEVKARGTPIVLVTLGQLPEAAGLADRLVELPLVHEYLEPLLFGTVLHRLAYEVGKQRGCEIDRPRNLAKSVTVE